MWHEQRSGPSLVLGWRAAQWDLLSVPVTSSSRPCPSSIYNSASSVRLALASPPVEKEQLPGPGERSIYKYGARKGWVRGGGLPGAWGVPVPGGNRVKVVTRAGEKCDGGVGI